MIAYDAGYRRNTALCSRSLQLPDHSGYAHETRVITRLNGGSFR